MANTSNHNIYYNDNGNDVADILADMKKQAESVDEALEQQKTNIGNSTSALDERVTQTENTIQEHETAIEQNTSNIANIKQEQTEQNESIQNNTTSIVQLQEENTLLEQNCLHNTEKGEIITVQDGAKWKKNKLGVFGYSEQETREGYNLFDVNAITEGIFINSNGTIGNSTASNVSDYIPVKANKTYTFSYAYATLSSDNERMVCFFDTDKNLVVITFSYSPTSKGFVYTAQQDGYIRITYDKGCTNIQLLEGTDIKPYEPYGAMPSPKFKSDVQSVSGNLEFVRCGKNLLDYDNATLFQGEKTVIDNKKAIKSPSNITNAWANIRENIFWNKLKNGHTYTISMYVKASKSINVNNQIFINKQSASWGITTIETSWKRASATFTFNSNNAPYIIHIYPKNMTSEDTLYIADIQIEEKVATEYEPYNENRYNFTLEDGQELCAIKTNDSSLASYTDENGQMWIADYLADDGIHKKMPYKVFDGTEPWGGYGSSDDYLGFHSFWGEDIINNLGMSNYFKSNSGAVYNKTDNAIWFAGNGGIRVSVSKSIVTDLDSWKAWLAERNTNGNPLKAYYLLKEETVIPYTTEQAEQYKALQNLSMQKGTNNLYCTNEFMKNMSLTYMRDTQMYIDNKDKEQDDRITAIEELLSTTATSAMLLDNLESDLESEV